MMTGWQSFAADAVRDPTPTVMLPMPNLPCDQCPVGALLARTLALYASVSPEGEQWAAVQAATLLEDRHKREGATAGEVLDFARWLLEWAPQHRRDVKRSLQLARRAAEMTRYEDADVLRVLALAAFRSGDSESAVQVQRKVVGMRPWDLSASEALKSYEGGRGAPVSMTDHE
jgi:hypothetical protein